MVSREAMAPAAVALAAAAALPDVPPAWLARELALGLDLAPRPGRVSGAPSPPGAAAPACGEVHGVVGAHLAAQGRSLRAELARVGPLGRVCALRGLVAVLPAATLCAPLHWAGAGVAEPPLNPHPTSVSVPGSEGLHGERGGGKGLGSRALDSVETGSAPGGSDGCDRGELAGGPAWTLLADGVLPAAAAAMAASPDAHFKFHAAQLVPTCLQRMEACLLVRARPADCTRQERAGKPDLPFWGAWACTKPAFKNLD